MEKDVMKALKLTSVELKNVAEKLNKLTAENEKLPSLAYAGTSNIGPRCGCKGSCEGGCTSW